jgi:hypothetical protein
VVAAAMSKIVYKLVSLVVSVLGGILAGAIFKRISKAAAGRTRHQGNTRAAWLA